jgi:YHYH protein
MNARRCGGDMPARATVNSHQEMKVRMKTYMKSTNGKTLAVMLAMMGLSGSKLFADPLVTSWFTKNAGQYARIQQTTGGSVMTTWTGQTLPAYSDVEVVSFSTNYVYVYTGGLASHLMGPWYLNAAKTMLFPNLPKNQKVTMRFPRTPAPAATNTETTGGAIGMYVNGVAVFNMLDGYAYNTSSGTDQQGMIGSGIWERDAKFGEALTFDPANAHQPQSGQYHCHINPIALRYQLGDNASYNSSANTYSENTNDLVHSSILGWAFDGYPIYGPYGYSNPTNPASGVRRMISGYVLRNGQYGTSNLNVTGRTTLPLWAQAAQSRTNLSSSQYGPSTAKAADMTGSFALGRYAEDNDYLGDQPTNDTVGAQWDLDRYNGRYCVTPDFPNGMYVYFVSINADGTSAFPYLVGRQFAGVVSGGTVSSITEPVTTNFTGGANAALTVTAVNADSTGDVTLTWSSVQGGTYVISGSVDLVTWTNLNPSVSSTGIVSQGTDPAATQNYTQRFYKVGLSSLATYDP